jgi:hypothetical protein
MTLNELGRCTAGGSSPEVEVHGISPMLYLIYLIVDGSRRPLQDERGRTLRFPSRAAAQRALSECGLQRATFVHTSPYGEMIGMTGSGQDTELREILILGDAQAG